MKRILPLFIISFFVICQRAHAQFEQIKDSVVQLYGVVLTADSLEAIPSVSVSIKGGRRGTITNEQGVFSIVVLKGDVIEFTSVGYKPKLAEIPRNLQGNQFSLVQLMVVDTQYLPVTIIRPRPTREQFDRDFATMQIPDDNYELARKNTDEQTRRALMTIIPADGKEAANYTLRKQAYKYTYAGQIPPMNIMNPIAWADFIKAWKRGDFKSKK
ncbi:carboxypeptidase-like regulatory domain-containing protein [Flavihumibacter profundi]|uniref:carboxypeptidase-like regulatory domain-containing protein n=1 Tax=Flavihumibacter profundi TaxID=2716883 RepID=UPI001CC70E1A|nr:carboxypeptidase-like regulatory domain-containing protein [Flavihumibacter profundi]MBZ5857201.1 carboxypeptidase-like regulatory domain-containing protein [Flavihumibacter profundi]